MTNDSPIIVGRADVVGWPKPKTLIFKFQNFASLPNRKGDATTSPALSCLGQEWRLKVYPSGFAQSEGGMMSVFLQYVGPQTGEDNMVTQVRAKCTFRIKARNGTEDFENHWEHVFTSAHSWGWPDFKPIDEVRNRFLDENGALTIEVDIQVWQETSSPREVTNTAWTPSLMLGKGLLRLLETGKFADVEFSVGNNCFRAHKCILFSCAPMLGTLIENAKDGEVIALPDVDPVVFEKVLYFVYSEEPPAVDFLREHACSLLEAADRFGFVQLKLVTQAEIVSSGLISVENAADLLVFADAHNCALLKEAAMDFFVSNRKDVMSTNGFSRLKESNQLLSELMDKALSPDEDGMRVASLWRELNRLGLSMDGSRQMLGRRLRES